MPYDAKLGNALRVTTPARTKLLAWAVSTMGMSNGSEDRLHFLLLVSVVLCCAVLGWSNKQQSSYTRRRSPTGVIKTKRQKQKQRPGSTLGLDRGSGSGEWVWWSGGEWQES